MPNARSCFSTSATRQPAGRGVQRDAGAGDAAADHDDVELFAVGQCRELGCAAGCVQCGGAGHGFRYPFSEWASSTAEGVVVEDVLDHLGGLNRRLRDQQAHRRELARFAGSHAALVLGELDRGGERLDEDLLAGAQPLGDVDHRHVRRVVQHRHDDFVAAQVFGHRDDALDHGFAPDTAGRHVVKDTGDARGEQLGEHKADIGPTAVDGRPADPRAPRDLGQRHPLDPVSHDARRGGIEDPGFDRSTQSYGLTSYVIL